MTMGSIPERTCIGCRRIVPSSDLVRLAAPDGRVAVATRRGGSAMPRQGRGAWVHARAECVGAAVQKRAFGRAFRGGVDAPDRAQLLADVRLAMGASSPEQGKSL
jgi:predicted RNA-binding protein YlxR (DUF448 family)